MVLSFDFTENATRGQPPLPSDNVPTTGFPGWTVARCFVAAHHAPADRRTTAHRHPQRR